MKNTPSPRAKSPYLALFFGALALSFLLSLFETLLGDPHGLFSLGIRAISATAILFLLLSERMLSLRPRISLRAPSVFAAMTLIFLVALNNFPFLDLLSHRTAVTITPLPLLFYILSSLATAAFEELLFRGLLFPLVCARLLKKEGKRGRRAPFGGLLAPILLSSAAFSLFHLLNLFTAAPLSVLLQLSYTFGIGILSSLLYLFTRSLLFPIAFHAIYNFGGLFLSAFGGVNDPALGTILFTTALTLACACVSARALVVFADRTVDFTN